MKFIMLFILLCICLMLTPLSAILILMSGPDFHEEAKWLCSAFVVIVGSTVSAYLIEAIGKRSNKS